MHRYSRLRSGVGLASGAFGLALAAACAPANDVDTSSTTSDLRRLRHHHDAGSIAMDAGSPAPAADAGDATDASDANGVAAFRANDFLNSIGICAHMAQGIDGPDGVGAATKFAGIRAVRDAASSSTVAGWLSVFQQSGARVALLPDGTVQGTIDIAKQLQAAGALLAVEGPNEPNNFPVTYQGQTSDYNGSFLPVANFQRDLYAAVKAEPTLATVPVFHSSEAGGSEPDNVGLQFLTVPDGAATTVPSGTRYADFANTHNYVCGHSAQLVDNVCWNAEDPTMNGDWDGMYVEYGNTWHGQFAGYSSSDLTNLPRVTTETGWTTSGPGSISQEQQGRLFLNLYLAAFKRGWSYTFIYMLRDDPVQGIWGLFDTEWQPKVSGTYLHNLTTILADTGAGSATGKLDYSIAIQPATVHDLLLQKTIGTFELVIWDERPSGGTDTVVVDLGGNRASVHVYDPTTGTAPTQTLTNVSSVTLTLTDHPNVIEL